MSIFGFTPECRALFIKPMHVEAVRITGLQINIPSRNMRQRNTDTGRKYRGKIKIVVAEIVCDSSSEAQGEPTVSESDASVSSSLLLIGTPNPDKDPEDFDLKHIVRRSPFC